ncbi:hypothetical protein GF327_03765 [Candidatus Woesearchaeota archaeon]|nr:hypothetical protein [Candidatus Woesearchaeota archaeon]
MKKEKIGTYRGLVFLFCLFVMWIYLLKIPVISAQADGNQTLNTTVNITNAAPEVKDIRCPAAVDLEAYGNKTVQCNVTVFDYDNNTNIVNATFYFNTVAAEDPDNKLNHYTNSSCVNESPQDNEMNFSCTFDLIYFANNGSWYSNATAYDDQDASGNNISDSINVNPLTAIYIPTDTVLDFGELETGQTSGDKEANITNAGNIQINISVQGWANTKGDDLAMDCEYGTIDRTYEKYAVTSGELFSAMTELPLNDEMIAGLFIERQTADGSLKTNTTYWKLEIPPSAGGICEGKLLFTASAKE